MMQAIDDELMKEHLKAHHAELAKLRVYQTMVHDAEMARLISRQEGMMDNHVSVMERLMQGDSSELPPIPIAPSSRADKSESHDAQLSDHDVAMDCRLTAEAMGADNYFSAQHMHDHMAKEIHFQMAEQNATISTLWAQYLKDHKDSISRAMR